MKLVVVESPAKARTISKFLGKDYIVVASKGHIRDLPVKSFAIKITDDYKFKPSYTITPGHKEIVKKIRELAKKADEVYIATDEDREGEAIGFHLAKVMKKNPKDLPRITFHEITKTAILNALKTPRKLDENLFNAQQSRRLLDRIVGYKLSPLLSKKILKGLSAGRVQSATLKLIVDREREIKKFKPEIFYKIFGVFKTNTKTELIKYNNKKLNKLSIKDEKEANKIVEELSKKDYIVKDIKEKETKSNPPKPLTTSTLQQMASTFLGYSPNKTMRLAQKLYEGVDTPKGVKGIITYMRTDSLNIAKEAQEAAIEFIKENIGENYLEPKTYSTKNKTAQEAHESIRPTDIFLTPEIMEDYLEKDEFKLYKLIFYRFLATQMKPAIYNVKEIFISTTDNKSLFYRKGKELLFDGYLKVYGKPAEDIIPDTFNLNEKLKANKIYKEKYQTKPPERYTEASIIKKMEQLGIGRPSTYAATISLLKNRKYIEVNKKQIKATEIAEKLIKALEDYFKEIVDTKFTANMEDDLDNVAKGERDWQELLKDFYIHFKDKLDNAYKKMPSQKQVKELDEECPLCGSRLVVRNSRFGSFIGCSNFPKCKYIKKAK